MQITYENGQLGEVLLDTEYYYATSFENVRPKYMEVILTRRTIQIDHLQ